MLERKLALDVAVVTGPIFCCLQPAALPPADRPLQELAKCHYMAGNRSVTLGAPANIA